MYFADSNNSGCTDYVLVMQKGLEKGLASHSSRNIHSVHRRWYTISHSAFEPEMIEVRARTCFDPHGEVFAEGVSFRNSLLGGKLEQWRSDRHMSSTTDGGRVSGDPELQEDDDRGRMAKAVPFDDLVEAMLILKPEILAFYSENNFALTEPTRCYKTVVQMTVDGCFVVELFRLYYDLRHAKSTGVADEADSTFTNPRIISTLRRDLLLLKNQLPFFVLEKLYELINKKNNIDPQQAVPLEVLALTFFDRPLPNHDAASKLDNPKPKHLLELVHSTFLQSVKKKVHKKGSVKKKVHKKGKNGVKSRFNPGGIFGVLHFASELEEAGVKFKKRKGDHDLLDIEFNNRTLWVPPLSIKEHTISLLLNCAQYEAASGAEPIFTNYLMFWNSLVNSPDDIQILHKHCIINNTFGSNKEVADLLRKIRDITYDQDMRYFYNEVKDMNDYCEHYYDYKSHLWWRSLIRERFSSPWTCLSLFAAIILLLLTTLQTFYTVYPYYRPH